jgi:hypothetical protein
MACIYSAGGGFACGGAPPSPGRPERANVGRERFGSTPMPACSIRSTKADCDNGSGCTWSGKACSTGCSDIKSSFQCDAHRSCEWDVKGKACEKVDCGMLKTPKECASTGCHWAIAKGASTSSCSAPPPA